MRVNFERIQQINRDSITESHGQEMASYFILQQGVERFLLGEELTEEYKNFMLDLGVLELTEYEAASQTIVGPFKFNNNGVKEAQ